MTTEECIARARAISVKLEALAELTGKLARERQELLLTLKRRHWSQREIAAGLGISQPRVQQIMKRA